VDVLQLDRIALSAFMEWITQAMEYVPLSGEAKPALDVLIGIHAELQPAVPAQAEKN
jgi:hypothetical protein